ncbi:hypothetical protein A2462_03120 [candidate division WOR-1 bacterium RIFOXYC2_FULL_41_25]|uniref:Uncharacterized protein n=1 Tax=candidate division WOR-1 bacterium RIFOXYC2_FULL_41_25 TaxID=1802586 RepID=A0A1F4TPQ8_UNCSA|nr:MAG: hypothetical protein A2385_06100 [Bdellovibrionales bacterium RIFOXYB1_FULL_39_21]OFZ41851.1 MAG: hypothetical protein A2485_08070 [Bdellovibrionales bacterium RIFOXYC12_FULL_39_17]OFZ50567.1 MAG: hypothetical protein A2404_05020 [Bdellovibrionales bacterium RIFOXYC1_FULL_39_130]OFZ77790.1 MAG: hypothetical protein A2560_00190 [Bdellovibrionales bacterium RIFOXYD1_FULL_39_84]OFZ93774.1 MAG: hypothetical protein A2504_05725 [Bdellovibrionales bacterium RIFOXYD12_FULL_39_22]OGC34695.1 MA
MNYHDIVVAVYDTISSENAGQFNYFKVIFDDSGEVDLLLLRELYKDSSMASAENAIPGMIGPFADLVELNRYALKLCEKVEKKQICIYSVDEYSAIIEKASTTEEFRELIVTNGNKIENLDYSKKGSFFKKIF